MRILHRELGTWAKADLHVIGGRVQVVRVEDAGGRVLILHEDEIQGLFRLVYEIDTIDRFSPELHEEECA